MIEPLTVAAAAAAAFFLSGIWYSAMPASPPSVAAGLPESEGTPPMPVLLGEAIRSVVVAAVVAGLASEIGGLDPIGGALLGCALWAGFPAVLFAGSILHERYPARLAAVHSGDWLLKLIAMGAIAGAMQ